MNGYVIPENSPVNCWVFRHEETKYVVGEDYTLFQRYSKYLLDLRYIESKYGQNFREINAIDGGIRECVMDDIDRMMIEYIYDFEWDIFQLNQKQDFGFVYMDMRYVE